jgi:CheY-like chemotaxis protein
LVVFVDLNMPIMNGFEMMRALKDIQKKEKKGTK